MFRLKIDAVHLLTWRSPSTGGVKFVGWDSKRKIYSTNYYENVGFGKKTTWVKTRKEINNKVKELISKEYHEVEYLREIHIFGHVHNE
jgi:ABC-type spermidine/putrescine transport systems, ATPase components